MLKAQEILALTKCVLAKELKEAFSTELKSLTEYVEEDKGDVGDIS